MFPSCKKDHHSGDKKQDREAVEEESGFDRAYTSVIRANRRMTRPDQAGLIRSAASFARRSQSKNSENTGTKKPWV